MPQYPLIAVLVASLILSTLPSAGAAQPTQWSTTALSTGRSEMVSASVGSKVLFAAGCKSGCHHPRAWSPSDVVDVYDSATGQWSASKLPDTRAKPAAVSVGGKALFAGGVKGFQGPVSAAVDIFDDATGTWSSAALSVPRGGITATAVGSKAMFAGGYTIGGVSMSTEPLDTVDIYDALTGQWSTARLSRRNVNPTTVSVDSKVLFVTGDAVDIYDDATGQWTSASLPVSRFTVTVAAVGTQVLFAGGATCDPPDAPPNRCKEVYSPAVDILDLATGQWSTATLSEPRRQIRAVTVGSQVLFAGGEVERVRPSATVDLYEATTGTWSTAKLTKPGWGFTATAVGTQALFVGGPSVDVYDAATGQWSVAQRTGKSTSPTVALVGSQAVFAEGPTIDLFESATGQWTAATLSQSRSQYTVGAVGSRMLFAGGSHSDPTVAGGIRYSTVVDVYDSAAEQ